MFKTFAPILCPVKGNPDISVSFANASCLEFNVFFGLALLETISAQKDNPEFKMFLGRLYNMSFSGRELAEIFEASRSSIARWGKALKSGDMKKMEVAFSGQGAKKKVFAQMVTFVKDQYREIHTHKRNYNQLIREKVQRYFGVSISSETARQIFAEVRNESTPGNEDLPLESNTQNEGFSTQKEPNTCETEAHSPANGDVLEVSRNLSDHPDDDSVWFSGVAEGEAVFNHHAGLVLMHHWVEKIVSPTGEALDRQTICQILLGAVNHEQAKTLSFSSLKELIGPVHQTLHYQRSQMDRLATPENTFHLQTQNTRLFQTEENDWFYFDPHSPKYTGVLPILKGWCGSTHQVEKVTHMDFIHDAQGNPCTVEHTDNYYEMRHRFFTCAANFHRTQLDPDQSICWVIDRGIYSLETLREIRKTGDEIITWEKNYRRDGWDETAAVGTTAFSIPRNNAQDLRLYKFEYQEIEWERDPSFRKIIVRATNPQNRTIEVSILCSDHALSEDTLYRTESRSELLIDENYVRLDFRRKAYMDALRIISRNIFYKLAREFREQYNNHREDHVILRHLTHSAGIITKSENKIEIALIPSMDILPKSKKIVEAFLRNVTRQIRETRPNASHEIEIQLTDKTEKRLTVVG